MTIPDGRGLLAVAGVAFLAAIGTVLIVRMDGPSYSRVGCGPLKVSPA